MFCPECGTKNKKDSLYCLECGHKLKDKEIKNNKNSKKENKKVVKNNDFKMNIIKWFDKSMDVVKKHKVITTILVTVIVIASAFIIAACNITNPATIATDYFDALASYNSDKIYKYLDVDDTTFTSKKMFEAILKNESEINNGVVENYKVGKTVISNDGLSATVTINYVLRGDSSPKSIQVNLVKSSDNKLLFFDNWKVVTNSYSTAQNYHIKVLKNSKVTIEGEVLSSSYISNKYSDDNFDVYIVPEMFKAIYKASIELPLGFTTETEINVNDQGYVFNLNLDEVSDDVVTSLESASINSLQAIYDGARTGKSFDDIKSLFDYSGADLSDLEKVYSSLFNYLNGDTTLTSITFRDANINNIEISKDGYLLVSLKVKYDYNVTYNDNEVKSNDGSDTDLVNLLFDYSDGFKLINAAGLNAYYSKY